MAATVVACGGQSGEGSSLLPSFTNGPGNNTPPLAQDDFLQIEEDQFAPQLNVLANDSDADADPLEVLAVDADYGQVVVNPDSTIDYTPPPDFFGVAKITYVVSDGYATAEADCVITITAVNDPPQLKTFTRATEEDTALLINVLNQVTDGDSDILQLTSAQADRGAVQNNGDGTLTYTPPLNYVGSATILYTVSDGSVAVTSEIRVNVVAANDPPVAVDDAIDVYANTQSILLDVLANDSDAEDIVPYISSATAAFGQVSLVNGRIFYTPLLDFVGDDQIEYQVQDSVGASASATATVSVLADSVVAIQLSWTIPNLREDGSALTTAEISGYEILVRPQGAIAGAESVYFSSGDSTGTLVFIGIPAVYEFAIATVDSEGLYSKFTDPIALDLAL